MAAGQVPGDVPGAHGHQNCVLGSEAAAMNPGRSVASRLEHLRRIASSEGIPLDCVGTLALKPARVARLLDVSTSTIENELAAGAIPTTWVRGSRRVAVLDLIEYMRRNRSLGPRTSREGSSSDLGSFMETFHHGRTPE